MQKHLFKRVTCITIAVFLLFSIIGIPVLHAESAHIYANDCLDMKYTSEFETVWSDWFSSCQKRCTFYKPIVPEGYYSLGYYGQGNFEAPKGSVLVVKEMPASQGAIAHPIDYKQVWKFNSVFSISDAAFWQPIPPSGYVSMGMVVTSGAKPALKEVVCVRKDLTVTGVAGNFIWDDTNSWESKKFCTWTIEPSKTPMFGMISTGNFVGVNSRTVPLSSPIMNCLTSRPLEQRLSSLTSALDKDGFTISRQESRFNKIAFAAEHRTSKNYDTGAKKKIYYLEGTNYEMGYNLGLLAENEISVMANDFSKGIILSYIKADQVKYKEIGDLLVQAVYELAKKSYQKAPKEIQDEIQGLYDGCKAANPSTKVDMTHLIALNMGIDVLCSLVYTGGDIFNMIPGLSNTDITIPIWCNAFDISGKSAGGGNYFGRDFMFSSAGVFQDLATMIIYNPDSNTDKKALPFVSVTAPGLIGCIAGMNINGVSVGVDMSPAMNCTPYDIGTNSLLLARRSIQFGSSAEQSVNIMKETQRGVSWNYIIADGTTDRSAIVEAGASSISSDFTKNIPDPIKPLLPDANFINSHKSADYQNGLMVRWNDYQYPTDYLAFNSGLWNYYNATQPNKITLYDDAFSAKGYINKTPYENNCPLTYYFAPQREQSSDILLTTNHYLIPEMKMFSMNAWDNFVIGNRTNDIQWRYDELNNQITTAIEDKGKIDYDTAKSLIDYLAPNGKFPTYYQGHPRSKDGTQIRIEGSVSLCDLKNKTIESHYGYYCDNWVKIALNNYFN